MQKWEYEVVVRIQEDDRFRWADSKTYAGSGPEVLNSLGQQGWELVNITAWNSRAGASSHAVIYMHYTFKRPLAS